MPSNTLGNDTIYLNPKRSFKSQVKKGCVYYVIRDSFDLKGRKVKLPRNSTFIFEGGYLVNGELNGNGSAIEGEKEHLFASNVSFSGGWSTCEVYPEWFGAVGDGLKNDTYAIQCALNSFSNVVLTGKYLVRDLRVKRSSIINGGCIKAFLDKHGNTRCVLSADGDYDIVIRRVNFDGSGGNLAREGTLEQMVLLKNCNSVLLEGCSFYNHSQNGDLPDEVEWQKRRCYALSILGAKNVVLDSCIFHDNHTEQVVIGSNTTAKNREPRTMLTIQNCKSYSNTSSLALFLLFELKSAFILNNDFRNNGRTFFNLMTNNVYFRGNRFYNTGSRGITSEAQGNYYGANNITIENNEIINAKEGFISVGNRNIRIVNNHLENDISRGNNTYLVRIGGVYTGNNPTANRAQEAIPFYNNTFSACEKGQNITVTGNTIIGSSKKGGVAVRVTECISEGGVLIAAGSVSNVCINDNILEITGEGSPVYFPNGTFNNITIENNIVSIYSGVPFVTMAPQTSSKIVKGSVNNLLISNNTINHNSFDADYLFETYCDKVGTVEIQNNEINGEMRKGITNFKDK